MTKTHSGFSLIEALFTLAIIAIIATSTLPNIGSTGDNERLKAAVRSLQSSLNLARSLAISRRQSITVCALDPAFNNSGNTPQCIAKQPDTSHWQHGWMVFYDKDRNHRLDKTDTLIRIQDPIKLLKITSSSTKGEVRLSSLGASVLSNQTWEFCLNKPNKAKQKAGLLRGYRLILSSPGLVRPYKIDPC